jgi:hypothetical protein
MPEVTTPAAAPDNRYPPTSTPEATPAETTAPSETTPTTTPPTTPPAEPDETDIFDLGASRHALDEAGGLTSSAVRVWNDAAGQHSCDARLAAVSADGVVLERAEGDEVRVPFESLSNADLQFVRRQIHASQFQRAAENAAIAASRGQ